jgi:hypothetical protein
MRKIIKEHKRLKIGACFGIFICILLMCFTIYFTPNFVANNLSPDGILQQITILEINFIRLGFGSLSTIGLLISALYIIKPNIFIKFYSKLYQIWKPLLKLMLFLFPIVFVICTVLLKSIYPRLYNVLMLKEDSTIEWLTFIFYFVAFIVAFNISTTFFRRNSALFCLMYMLLSIGLFLIAMEEISWGQRILGIGTPKFFSKYNVQREMNFHNIAGAHFFLHTLVIVIGLYGGLARFLIPKSIIRNYRPIVNYFTPDYYLVFYFLIIAILLFYMYPFSSLIVSLMGDQFGVDKGYFIRSKDQEPAEFLLSCGFLLFVTINKYRQVSNKNF